MKPRSLIGVSMSIGASSLLALEAGSEFFIRNARQEDADFLLSLRNHPQMVALSSSQREIDAAEHQTWLASILQSEHHLLFIIEQASTGVLMGYARLDCSTLAEAVITVVLTPEVQGKGIGTLVIRDVCTQGFLHWPKLERILATIRQENTRSQAAFRKAGFRLVEQQNGAVRQVVMLMTAETLRG